MDEYHTVEERKEVLCKFLKKMADSGYGPPTREEILKSELENTIGRYLIKRQEAQGYIGGLRK